MCQDMVGLFSRLQPEGFPHDLIRAIITHPKPKRLVFRYATYWIWDAMAVSWLDPGDCYADTMLHVEKILQKGKYRDKGKSRRWFNTVATRKIRKIVYKEAKKHELEDSLEDLVPEDEDRNEWLARRGVMVCENNPYRVASEAEISRLLVDCIQNNNLTALEKLVITLYTFDRRTYKQIADLLGLTEDIVKNNLYTARKKVRKCVHRHLATERYTE